MADGPEKRIENRIKKSLAKNKVYYVKNFAGPMTNKGIPDITGVCNSTYFALEIKKPQGGKPTPIQLHNLAQIAFNNGFACVTNDPGIVENCLLPLSKNHRTLNIKFLKELDNFHYMIVELDKDKIIRPEAATKLWQTAEHQNQPVSMFIEAKPW